MDAKGAGGGKDLEEPLVMRPTSEPIVNHMLSQVATLATAHSVVGSVERVLLHRQHMLSQVAFL